MKSDIYSKNSIGKKILKIVLKILYQILIIMCLILAMVIVLQKVTDSNRSIAGYRIFRVITGSMLPQYDVGEVVISKEVNPEAIKVGDDIVYKGTFSEYAGKIIMHKVIEIDRDSNNDLNFHAKGLHDSSVEDPKIKASQIYGVVKLKSGLLTLLYNLATNIYSAFVIITILVLNVFVSFRFSGKSNKRTKKLGLSEAPDGMNYNGVDYGAGYGAGYDAGYDTGYDDGCDAGYDAGFEENSNYDATSEDEEYLQDEAYLENEEETIDEEVSDDFEEENGESDAD